MYHIELMDKQKLLNKQGELKIYYSTCSTPFGICLIASTSKGICNILFADTVQEASTDLQSRWKYAELISQSTPDHQALENYFNNNSPIPKVTLHITGTDFQVKVWRALLEIPRGHTSSYGEIARRLGDTKLSRAVGTAIGNNPIGYFIPCHRVLTSTGALGGFRWGLARKQAMLNHEQIYKNN